MTCPRSSNLIGVKLHLFIGVILHLLKRCIRDVKVYFKRCCITPIQKVLNRCRLKVYFQRQDSTGYTAIGQSGRSQLFSLCYFFLQKSIPFTTDSTGHKLKWLLKKVSAFATYDLYLFYVTEQRKYTFINLRWANDVCNANLSGKN